jgi:hypothetical protein
VESIKYYQRALAISPDFPDVVCGLVNALSSICDWRGYRGSTGSEPIVNEQLAIIFRATKQDFVPHGWMGKLEKVTKKQLSESYAHGTGLVRLVGPIEYWLALVEMAHGSRLTGQQCRYAGPCANPRHHPDTDDHADAGGKRLIDSTPTLIGRRKPSTRLVLSFVLLNS